MNQYTGDELTNKIHTFMARKTEKFPELNNFKQKPVRRIALRDRRTSNIFTALENLNTLWGQRIHS
jgi:hypothetical protein